MNSTAVKVHWKTLSCTHANGDITGYIIYYGKYGSNHNKSRIDINNGRQTSFTISGLYSLTNYTISIAAVNANGTGPNTSLNLICKLLLLLST